MAAIPEVFSTGGQSTLNGSILSGATSLVVTSAGSFPSSGTFRIKIDTELFKVTAVSGTTFTVVGAQESTIAAAHSNGATVTEELTAAALVAFQSDTLGLATQASMPGGKLTLTSGTPVTTADISGASSVYYTPFRSNVVSLWDGAYWQRFTFAELTLALGTVTASLPYDVFLFISGGVVAIEKLAWTSALVRATNITIQDGRYCKSGAKDRLYVGSFVTTSSTTTEDSEAKPFVFNAYHAAARRHVGDGTEPTNLTTASALFSTISANLNTSIFLGLPQVVDVSMKTTLRNSISGGTDAYLGLQVDGGTTYYVAISNLDRYDVYYDVNGSKPVPMAAGLHTLGFMWLVSGAGTAMFDGADRPSSVGSALATHISCLITR